MEGTLDGRPIRVFAREDTVTVELTAFASMRAMRRSWPALRPTVTPLSSHFHLTLRLKPPLLHALTVLPRRGLFARFLLPG